MFMLWWWSVNFLLLSNSLYQYCFWRMGFVNCKVLQIAWTKFFSQNPWGPRLWVGFGSVWVPRPETELEILSLSCYRFLKPRPNILVFKSNFNNSSKILRYSASVRFRFRPSFETENWTKNSEFWVTTNSSNQDRAES